MERRAFETANVPFRSLSVLNFFEDGELGEVIKGATVRGKWA